MGNLFECVILCRVLDKTVCDIECGAWVGLCCFMLSLYLYPIFIRFDHLIPAHWNLLWQSIHVNRFISSAPEQDRITHKHREKESLVRILLIFAKLKTSAEKKVYRIESFSGNVCVCTSTENWLKCSDIVWIMSIDKSSLVFRCFSLALSLSHIHMCTFCRCCCYCYFVLCMWVLFFIFRFSSSFHLAF